MRQRSVPLGQISRSGSSVVGSGGSGLPGASIKRFSLLTRRLDHGLWIGLQDVHGPLGSKPTAPARKPKRRLPSREPWLEEREDLGDDGAGLAVVLGELEGRKERLSSNLDRENPAF